MLRFSLDEGISIFTEWGRDHLYKISGAPPNGNARGPIDRLFGGSK